MDFLDGLLVPHLHNTVWWKAWCFGKVPTCCAFHRSLPTWPGIYMWIIFTQTGVTRKCLAPPLSSILINLSIAKMLSFAREQPLKTFLEHCPDNEHFWKFIETFANSCGCVPVSSLTVSRLSSDAKWQGESSSWIISLPPLHISPLHIYLVFIAELAAFPRHFRAPSQDQVVRVAIGSDLGILGRTDLPEQK